MGGRTATDLWYRFAAVCLVVALAACAAPAKPLPPITGSGFEPLDIPLIEPGKPVASDSTVTGYLFRPAGSGPFPAVILIHGCNGLDWQLPNRPGWVLLRRYAQRYADRGYIALVLDSFGPRGVTNICGNPRAVSFGRRAWDVYSAARMLAERPDVDRQRLVLQGDSHGGSTTLLAIENGRWHGRQHFAAAIAWYPGCFPLNGVTTPLLILIGENDDWTPADRCKAMVNGLPTTDRPEVTLRTYPGATHAYDFPLPTRTNSLGHHMAYDLEATTDSWATIDAFLARHVK